MKALYGHADKALKGIREEMEEAFQTFSTTMGFDEMNYIDTRKAVTALYERLDAGIRRELRKVIRRVRKDAEDEIGFTMKDFDSAAFLLGLLKRPDPVTKYVYTREWNRKRDRLVESLMASNGNQEVREALNRALNVTMNQVRQYADNVTDETRIEVFSSAGIAKVMWNTQRDGKVCAECAERDGNIYEMGHLPDKHHRCRCFLTAVK